MLITDWSIVGMLEKVEAAVRATKQVAVQHRHPAVTDRQFFEEARALASVCQKHGAPLFINRRLDVALALDANLHLPTHALRVSDVRPFLGHRLVSVAVHELTEVQEGADLALVSPVFPPKSKPTDTRATLGPQGFFNLARGLGCPAFALGGVGLEKAHELGGAPGLAVVSAVLLARDPGEAARRLVEGSVAA